MKFLVDANIPFKLVLLLRQSGHDTTHTDNLPDKERTKDSDIRKVSVEEERIVITKDSDFLDSHIIQGIPRQVLLVTTGNITNKELFKLFELYFERITLLFETYNLIELNQDGLIAHE